MPIEKNSDPNARTLVVFPQYLSLRLKVVLFAIED